MLYISLLPHQTRTGSGHFDIFVFPVMIIVTQNTDINPPHLVLHVNLVLRLHPPLASKIPPSLVPLVTEVDLSTKM